MNGADVEDENDINVPAGNYQNYFKKYMLTIAR